MAEAAAAARPTNTKAAIQHDGWLYKLGGFIKNWKKRWFVIRKGELMYFEEKSHVNQRHLAKGVLVLRGARAISFSAKEHKEYAFGVRPHGTDRTYIMVAETADERRRWLTFIAQLAGQSDEIEEVLDGKVVSDSIREGYLLKQGGLFGTWKIRYFIITATAHLLYFDDKTAVTHGQSGWSVPLIGATITAEPESFVERKYAVSIVPRNDPSRKYIMVAGDDEEFDEWFNSLQVAASGTVSTTPSGRRSIVADGSAAKSPSSSGTTAGVAVAAAVESSDDSEGSDTEDEKERVKASGGKGSAAALAHERRKKREHDDSDDDDHDHQSSNKAGKVKASTLAAPVNHTRQGSAGAATAATTVAGIPLTDGRLWRFDEHEDDAAHAWKQRYFLLNPRTMTFAYWHHKRQMLREKPTRTHDLTGATLAMDATTCAKAREPGCVFSITLAAKKKSSKAKKLLFATSSRKNLAQWWPALNNALMASPPSTVAAATAATPVAVAPQASASTPAATNVIRAVELPSFAAASASSSIYFSPASLTTKLQADLQKYKDKIINNPTSLAPIEIQMLSSVKGDLDIFVKFRGSSVAFSRGQMSHHEYFAAFFEAFGVVEGMALWDGLLEVVPDAAKKEALQRLMADNKSFLISTLTPQTTAPHDDDDDDFDDASDAATLPTTAISPTTVSSKPVVRKPAIAKPKFEDELRRRQQMRDGAPSSTSSMAKVETKKGSVTGGGADAANRRVTAWIEETGTLSTMLATLDMIFPGIPKGMFEPSPTADFPALKKIYLRALPRIHPDKQSSSTIEQQQLSGPVYSALSAAFDRSNRKHLKFIASAGARSPPQ